MLWVLAPSVLAPTVLTVPGLAQPSTAILAPWDGPQQFPQLYRQSIDAFFSAEDAYRKADYAGADRILTAFWRRHPAGTIEWASAVGDDFKIYKTIGANFGNPACYYALRMLTECVNWRVHGKTPPDARTIRWTVALTGHLNDRFNAPDRIFDPALYLFREYIQAITKGRLRVDVNIVRLPEVELSVAVERSADNSFDARPNDLAPVWNAIDDRTVSETDWTLVIYPSRVPESAQAKQTEYITGGMYGGTFGFRAPAFVIDDLWFVRVPPHMGKGPMDEMQLRAYIPQWLQHEFFHHLFGAYPNQRLEITPHQWFDRLTWPEDFTGWIEPDYYAEAVRKRLSGVDPPLSTRLQYASTGHPGLARLSPAQIPGKYRTNPRLNDWNEGTIEPPKSANDSWRWRNRAGVSWILDLNLSRGVLATYTDCPYYFSEPERGRYFKLVLRRDANGREIPEIAGFEFNGARYERLP
jgi:hypothetical protein